MRGKWEGTLSNMLIRLRAYYCGIKTIFFELQIEKDYLKKKEFLNGHYTFLLHASPCIAILCPAPPPATGDFVPLTEVSKLNNSCADKCLRKMTILNSKPYCSLIQWRVRYELFLKRLDLLLCVGALSLVSMMQAHDF